MFFDSHAHLDDPQFDSDRENLILSLKSKQVSYAINAGSDIETSKKSLDLAEKHDFIYAVCGIHPHATETLTEADFETLKGLLKHKKCLAMGEIGLDYHYDLDFKEKQIYWFEKQLEYAVQNNIPVVIHDRDAHEDCLQLVKKHRARGVFHCFSGSWEMAKELLKMDFYLSFNGVVTFKNAKKTVQVIENMPLNRLLIETDCPYLTPEPFRGTRNDPGLISYTAKKIAEIKNLSVEEIAFITSENTKALYSL